jgi:hypothetical protein
MSDDHMYFQGVLYGFVLKIAKMLLPVAFLLCGLNYPLLNEFGVIVLVLIHIGCTCHAKFHCDTLG